MELKKALTIAEDIVAILAPYCQKIEIAGSCRRQKTNVKDIEIICLPKVHKYKNLFGEEIRGKRLPAFAEQAELLGQIEKGSLQNGKYVKMNLKEGISLDLFMPDEDDYYRMLAIRTGSEDYSHTVFARGWRMLGWVGSDMGLRRKEDCVEKAGKQWKCINTNGQRPPVWKSEQEFFEWIGVDWIEPAFRNV